MLRIGQAHCSLVSGLAKITQMAAQVPSSFNFLAAQVPSSFNFLVLECIFFEVKKTQISGATLP